MNSPASTLLIAPKESATLARELSRITSLPLVELEDLRFEAGEFKLRPCGPVRGSRVFVVQSLAGSAACPVAERLVRLLFLLLGLRDAGASDLTAVLPYLSFARMDRRTQPRDPVNARYVAQLIETTAADRIVALDVHNPAALDNAFRIPVDHLSAIPMFVDHFAAQQGAAALAVASPDVGGIKRAQIFRELLERRLGRCIELAFIEKRRTGDAVTTGRVVGDVDGRTVLVVDDLCATGGTLTRAAAALRGAGARSVQVAFTHAPLADGLDAITADRSIERVVFTDSVGVEALEEVRSTRANVQRLPIAPLLGEAIVRTLRAAPLAPLQRSWPPDDGADAAAPAAR